jgi:hypothetical protein
MLRLASSAAARSAAFAAAITATVFAADARAYCRATTCTEKAGMQVEGTECVPPTPDDCGKPIVWTRNCLGFAVQKDGSKKAGLTANDTRLLMRQAFATWETADCGDGAGPRVHVTDLGVVDCDAVEYNDKAGNVNAVVFRDTKWPHPAGTHNIALTTVTYDSQSGAIYDADMEINSAGDYPFTTADTNVQYDFLSVVQHETGHFLGLGHSKSDDTATMNAVYSAGSIDFRTLSADDVTAICATYPPTTKGPVPVSCNPIPRHGFSPECLANQTEGTCCFAPPMQETPPWTAIAAALTLALASARRRRAKRR